MQIEAMNMLQIAFNFIYFIVTAKRGNHKISGSAQATYFCQNYTTAVCTVSCATPSTFTPR